MSHVGADPTHPEGSPVPTARPPRALEQSHVGDRATELLATCDVRSVAGICALRFLAYLRCPLCACRAMSAFYEYGAE
eukprot:983350-Prymnesium_polylepis.1